MIHFGHRDANESVTRSHQGSRVKLRASLGANPPKQVADDINAICAALGETLPA